MNLLSLCGALMTATASVSAGPISSSINHQNKMMDVEYKYQSNVVNSYNDIIVGNIYQFNDINVDSCLLDIIDTDGSFDLVFKPLINISGEIDSPDSEGNNYLSLTQDNLIGLSYTLGEGSMYVRLSYSNMDDYYFDINGDFYFLDYYAYIPVLIIYFDVVSADTSYLNLPLSRTDYNEIVPSNSHRGNLYTTIYDFFYGIFDTSDTNELSMTIMGQNMNLTSWLAHSVTILLLALGIFWLILVIRWIFRVFSGLVKI